MPGECTNPTYGLHCHMGSSGWSPGLWQRPNSPGDPRLVKLVARVPIILGTPTISHIMNVIKEKEIDALAMPWVNAQVAYLLALQQAMATVENDKIAAGSQTLVNMMKWSPPRTQRPLVLFHPTLYMPEGGWLIQERGWMWWLGSFMLKMGPYHRVWQCRTLTQSCTRAARMSP